MDERADLPSLVEDLRVAIGRFRGDDPGTVVQLRPATVTPLPRRARLHAVPACRPDPGPAGGGRTRG